MKNWNLMPLCFVCHESIHRGMSAFLDKWPSAKKWLIDNGWFFCKFQKKYKHNGAFTP